MASRQDEFEALQPWAVDTLAETPSRPSHTLGWLVEDTWVAVVPLRRAHAGSCGAAVLLLAVPGEYVEDSTVPLAPSGDRAHADVAAASGRGRCRVTFLAVPESDLEETLATVGMVEAHGFTIAGFGPTGVLVPRGRDLLLAAARLGFTESSTDVWASAASGAEEGLPFEDFEFDPVVEELTRHQLEIDAEQEASLSQEWSESRAEGRARAERPECLEEGLDGSVGDGGVETPTSQTQVGRGRGSALPRSLGMAPPLRAFGRAQSHRLPASQPSGPLGANSSQSAAAQAAALLGSGPPRGMAEVPAPRGRGAGRGNGKGGRAVQLDASQPLPGRIRTSAKPKAKNAGQPPPAAPPAWAIDPGDLGEEYTLQDLLAAGVDVASATQLMVAQALGKMASAQAQAEVPAKKSGAKKKVFGLAAEGGDDGTDDDDENGGSGFQGARGSAASSMLRESMRRHPQLFSQAIRRRAAEALEDSSTIDSPDLMLRNITEEIPIQGQKALGYLLYGLGHIHKAMREGRTDDAELLTLRLIAASDQTSLDSTWRVGWGLTGLSEPAWNRWSQVDHASLRRAHAASRLVGNEWMGIEVARLRDLEFLMKQRPVNKKGEAKGDGKGDGK